MNQSVSSQNVSGSHVELAAGEVSHATAGLPHDEAACSRIPGGELVFPETFKAAASYETEIQCGRAVASYAMGHIGERGEPDHIVVMRLAGIRRKPSGQHACGERGYRRDFY